jgi:hypothetical protein
MTRGVPHYYIYHYVCRPGFKRATTVSTTATGSVSIETLRQPHFQRGKPELLHLIVRTKEDDSDDETPKKKLCRVCATSSISSVCCVLYVVCCMLYGVWRMLYVVCCMYTCY